MGYLAGGLERIIMTTRMAILVTQGRTTTGNPCMTSLRDCFAAHQKNEQRVIASVLCEAIYPPTDCFVVPPKYSGTPRNDWEQVVSAFFASWRLCVTFSYLF